MKILIVEDDPNLQELLAEFVKREILEAEICQADNLNDAVAIICSAESPAPSPESRSPLAGILCDGMFPTWGHVLRFTQWNRTPPNWIGIAGWANRKHIPLVVLTGDAGIFEHARRIGVAAYLKPDIEHAAIARLRELVVPKAVRENPLVAEVDLTNEEVVEDEVKGRKLKVERTELGSAGNPSPESRVPSPEADATGEP